MRYILLLILPALIISCRAVFDTGFFYYCERGLPSDIRQQKAFILEADKNNNILVSSNFAEYKQFENQKMDFYKAKRIEIEGSSDHDYLFSSTYAPRRNCDTKEKYLSYLDKDEEITRKTFDKKENDKEILEIKNYIKNLEAKDKEIKNQTNSTMIYTAYEMSEIIRKEGFEDAKKFLFVASDQSKYFSNYSFLLSQIQNTQKYYFYNINNLKEPFQWNRYYENYKFEIWKRNHNTSVEELSFTEVIVYAEYNKFKSKFIIKPKKGQTFNLEQRLDEYAFKIIGKQEYKGETLAVVEALN